MAIFSGIKKAKMFLAKPISMWGFGVGRCMSKFVGSNRRKTTGEASAEEDQQLLPADTRRVWMPHRHTGIYFPKGQESVMDDIPKEAASFVQTFWLRNTDGVDQDKQETPDKPETP